MIAKKNITKVFFLFLFLQMFLWTLIPSISNENLPLDTIEACGGGSARCMMAEVFLPKTASN